MGSRDPLFNSPGYVITGELDGGEFKYITINF